jgi:hypothetical protein
MKWEIIYLDTLKVLLRNHNTLLDPESPVLLSSAFALKYKKNDKKRTKWDRKGV